MAAKKRDENKRDNSPLILLVILLAFLAVIDIASLYIWSLSKPSSASNSSSSAGQINTAKVSEIIDGKTIRMDNGDYVKLIGIDSPDQNSPFYQQSIDILTFLVLNKQVKLESDVQNTDSQGNLLRYVYVQYNNQELFVNKEIVRQGLALPFAVEPNTKYRTDLEAARNECLQSKLNLCG